MLCPGWRQSPHSLGRLDGGSSVLVLVMGVEVVRGGAGEGEGVGDREWEGEESGSPGSGQVVSFKLSGQNSLILDTTAAEVRPDGGLVVAHLPWVTSP